MFGSALALLASFLGPAVQAPPSPAPSMTVDRVADDFYGVRGEGGNTSVYVTDEGMVLPK